MMDSLFMHPRTKSNGTLEITRGGKGTTITDPKSIDSFRRAFLARYPADPKAKLRKLRAPEIRLFLSSVPFDAEEPLFVIETGGHKFIINLDKDLHLLWIDDYLHLP
jgi:protein tyrosine/serine phosphatase